MDLSKEQRADPDLQILIDYLENKKLPEDEALAKEVVSKAELYFYQNQGSCVRSHTPVRRDRT